MPASEPRLTDPTGAPLPVEMIEGPVVDAVLEAIHRHAANLLVIATAGYDAFLDARRGSTTERVRRGATCPWLALPAESVAVMADESLNGACTRDGG